MAEQVLKGVGVIEREIDLTEREQEHVGTPALVIGQATKGPAYVPVTVGSAIDFFTKFGGLDPDLQAPYSAVEFLKHRPALTFVRVLGAGANTADGHINRTLSTGKVRNAGTVVTGSAGSNDITQHVGAVQFIVAKHVAAANETYGMRGLFYIGVEYFFYGRVQVQISHTLFP